MKKDPSSSMLHAVMKNVAKLSYELKATYKLWMLFSCVVISDRYILIIV
ncbi:hypothetical protein RchiOBHm_Chr2g0100641 [Rosa chinensis]|uniref:Uncharacterized protein n=1 Tax=Rosa chinensis TaxID=74649 RepID=A0A2P6RM77_ROSCH|nr:hypothetical protein RchiOBHm_Chr2g0100641 [Rosa chinensis]